MSLYTNILIIMVVINVGLLFFGVDSGATATAKLITVDIDNQTIAEASDTSNTLNSMLVAAGVSAGIGIATYLVAGGTTAIYISILAFLFSFAFLPISILTHPDIPFMVRAVIGTPLVIAFIISLVNWFRGISD